VFLKPILRFFTFSFLVLAVASGTSVHAENANGSINSPADHRPTLIAAGFEVELYEEPVDWRRQQQAATEGLLASEQDLAADLERPTVDQFMRLARGMLAEMPRRRYVSVIARLR
jgi:hypothetical protein